VIPIRDSVRTRSFPYVNVAIILVNIAVFLYEVNLSQQRTLTAFGVATQLDVFTVHWGNIPACTFDALGRATVQSRSIVCRDQPNPILTPFSAMFIHGSWLHIAGNMLFLWIFGDNVEDAMGHARYLVFYLLVGLLAAFAHGMVDATSLTPAIGASGAISGVMGAYIVLFPRATVAAIIGFIIIPIPIPAWVMIGFWFVTQVFYGVSSLGNVDAVGAGGGIAYFAHIGGFIAGAALVHVFVLGRGRRASARGRYQDVF
jgi:membrane associated rhomboid family serine protease